MPVPARLSRIGRRLASNSIPARSPHLARAPSPCRPISTSRTAQTSSRSETRYEAASALATSPEPQSTVHDFHPASSSTSSHKHNHNARQRHHVLPPLLSSTPSRSDDERLKAHFDHPDSSTSPASAFTARFRSSTQTQSHQPGLFLYPPLTSPSALPRLTDRTLIHAQHIVDRINSSTSSSDPTGRELRLVVKNLDRLSDLLCGVIDMCELIRNVHPDEAWVMESERTYERLCSFMNELNTDTKLYDALLASLQHPHPEPLSQQETQVALTFLRDFEKSGIHLPPDIRARFVEISDSLLSLGRTFLSHASSGPSPHPPLEIPEADRLLAGMGSQFIDSLTRGKGSKKSSVLITPGSWEAQMIGRYAREGEARRLVHIASMRPDAERINVLEQLLKERAELAGVLGKETWADVVLTDKMAKTPSNVMGFLSSLAQHHRPAAATDIAALRRIKAINRTGIQYPADASLSVLPEFHAWDRDYYSEKMLMNISPTSSLPPITPYFSTGTCLLGLSRLFSKLYGISFKPAGIASGEAWHPSVRRLDVVHETEGQIGVVYCDLFSRDGKPPSAAHYTVRCSRRVDDDDLAGDGLPDGWDANFGPGLESEGENINGKQGRFQLPIVVLTTDFGVVRPDQPALLAWNEVETLFHEMGHAIHCRTEYHNVSGTRCATDFVELPSILMEHFVSSPEVLATFATHHATGDPLPRELMAAHLDIQRSLSSLETHGQIVMAILDQKYHSLSPNPRDLDQFDSTRIYQDLQREIGVIDPVEGTAWQTQFGHLYGYGATYYSYLFDRAIAGKVWSTLFSSSPDGSLSREGGEVFKEKVLKWGGGRDPWEMVGDVVGGREGELVSKGDGKAMGQVGKWLTKS